MAVFLSIESGKGQLAMETEPLQLQRLHDARGKQHHDFNGKRTPPPPSPLALMSIESKQNEADPTGDAADARTVEPAEIDNYSRYYTRIQDRPL